MRHGWTIELCPPAHRSCTYRYEPSLEGGQLDLKADPDGTVLRSVGPLGRAVVDSHASSNYGDWGDEYVTFPWGGAPKTCSVNVT
eukprot:1129894-Prymnesium_polylepis.2